MLSLLLFYVILESVKVIRYKKKRKAWYEAIINILQTKATRNLSVGGSLLIAASEKAYWGMK